MLKQSKTINENYACRILRVDNIEAIPDAHSLVKATVGTDKAIVSKDTKVGDIVAFFPLGSVICAKYLSTNNLYQDYKLNSNAAEVEEMMNEANALSLKPDGKPAADILAEKAKRMRGMFNEQGRVKMIKLRGEYSNGFITPISTLENVWPELRNCLWSKYLDKPFDMIGDELLCWKYVPKANMKCVVPTDTNKHKKSYPKFNRVVPEQFAFHYDTKHLDRNAENVLPTDRIWLTVKLHGTSEVLANVLVKKKLNMFQKMLKAIGIKVQEREYGGLYSTRRVIQNAYGDNHMHPSGAYYPVYRDLMKYIAKGMTVYGEVVGYVEGTNKCIQSPHGVDHDYGCKPGEWSFMPYRITETDEAGNVKEWGVEDVIKWTDKTQCLMSEADRHKLRPMTWLYHGYAGAMYGLWEKMHTEYCNEARWEKEVDAWKAAQPEGAVIYLPRFLESPMSLAIHVWQVEWIERMKADKDILGMELPEPLCNNKKAPREGVVLRIDNDPTARAFKLKTKAHYALAQKAEDAGQADPEDLA